MRREYAEYTGERIKYYRKHNKMTQQELAAAICRSKATLSKYEHGKISIDMETLYDIAAALGVSVWKLLRPTAPSKEVVSDLPFFHGAGLYYVYMPLYEHKWSKRQYTVSILEIERTKDGYEARFFYNCPANKKEDCFLLFVGKSYISGVGIVFFLRDPGHVEDLLYIYCSPSVYRTDYLVGLCALFSGYPLQPLCHKTILSSKPLEDAELIADLLSFSAEEIRGMRKSNIFSLLPYQPSSALNKKQEG